MKYGFPAGTSGTTLILIVVNKKPEFVGDYESCNTIKRFVDGPMELLENNPAEDRLSESVQETSSRPPLIIVMDRSWSPSIYGAVRLLGNTVDVVWRMAFIHPLTFI